jgi:hypothetical protein
LTALFRSHHRLALHHARDVDVASRGWFAWSMRVMVISACSLSGSQLDDDMEYAQNGCMSLDQAAMHACACLRVAGAWSERDPASGVRAKHHLFLGENGKLPTVLERHECVDS